jgi:fructose-1,6-bisphosphatase/inositol monophosphatase family enzyme
VAHDLEMGKMEGNENTTVAPVIDDAQVKGWVREAGQIAMHYFTHVDASRKADNTLVTRADRDIEELLTRRIRAVYPDHALIAEEGATGGAAGSATSPAGAECLWAIDPIDGTRAFVQGLPGWGISVGLLRHGQPHWGLFYMPLLDDWTYTEGQDSAFWNGRELWGLLRQEWDDQSFLAISSHSHSRYCIEIELTRALGSIGAGMVYTARGSALGALLDRAFIWDLAAGAAILARAGAAIRYLSGRTVIWAELADGRQAAEPIVVAHPALMDRIRGSVWPR